jgi:CRISPR/Cas system-associated exonuclease Cas4 (RecB family)
MIQYTLSADQEKLAYYLAQKLGFTIGKFTQDYFENFVRFSHFDYQNIPVYRNFVIEFLRNEIEIREKSNSRLKKALLNSIKATDIENFTFCPVAYSISNTYNIPKTDLTTVGTSLHETEILNPGFKKLGLEYGFGRYLFANKNTITARERLIDEIDEMPDTRGQINYLKSYFNGTDTKIIDDIAASELLFPTEDTMDLKDKVFKSLKGKFVGRPDYIFKNSDSNKVYVVEEKFQLKKGSFESDKKKGFYENHSNQLRSYMYCINDYEISYGYLVYWEYNYVSGIPRIESARVKKIVKSPIERDRLEKVYRMIQKALVNRGGDFIESYRNPKKCAACGASVFCGHKTGRYRSYTLPYSSDHVKMFSVSYPDELRKSSKTEIITIEEDEFSLYHKIFKKYFPAIFRKLNITDVNNNVSRYRARWNIDDNKLFISSFVVYKEKLVNRQLERLHNYDGPKIFADFINDKIRCYRKIESNGGSLSDNFIGIELSFKKGELINKRDL